MQSAQEFMATSFTRFAHVNNFRYSEFVTTAQHRQEQWYFSEVNRLE